jgi:hypothetical protein
MAYRLTPEEIAHVNAAIDEMEHRKQVGRAFAAAYYEPICLDPGSKLNMEMQQPPLEIDDWHLGCKRYEKAHARCSSSRATPNSCAGSRTPRGRRSRSFSASSKRSERSLILTWILGTLAVLMALGQPLVIVWLVSYPDGRRRDCWLAGPLETK